MTAQINNLTATTEVNGEEITLSVAGQTLKLNVKNVTAVTDALLAARKAAYANKRVAKPVPVAAAAPAKKQDRKTTKAAGTSGRKASRKDAAKHTKRGTRAQAVAA